jgi:DNA-binding FadR family transcriptional regulator
MPPSAVSRRADAAEADGLSAGLTAHRHTLDALGEAVVNGRYLPGASIPPEPTLCQTFGVSRTVVREAVKSLVAKGLLVTGPKLGTRVVSADQWNLFDPDVVRWHGRNGVPPELLRDLQELRRVVEPAAVRLAALRASAEDIVAIEDAFAGMRQAIEQGGDYVTHDLRFHQGLLRASRNRMMAQMSKALGALLRTSFEVQTSRPEGAARSLPLHRAVLDAVIARRPAQAERAIRVLIDGAEQDIDHVLGTRRPLPSLTVPPPRLAAPPGGEPSSEPSSEP